MLVRTTLPREKCYPLILRMTFADIRYKSNHDLITDLSMYTAGYNIIDTCEISIPLPESSALHLGPQSTL